MAKKMHTQPQIVRAPLSSEKKILALTNSSTLPLKGQMVHP